MKSTPHKCVESIEEIPKLKLKASQQCVSDLQAFQYGKDVFQTTTNKEQWSCCKRTLLLKARRFESFSSLFGYGDIELYESGGRRFKPYLVHNMITNTGYRQMLRDRIPRMVNLALLSCRCKEKWLDHVYHNWIWIYKDNNERLKATRDLLGIDEKGKVHFNFEDTIMWDNLTIEEKKFWKTVISRVSWFRNWHLKAENAYTNSLKVGRDITAIKIELMRDYLPDMCPTKEDSTEVREKKNKEINAFVDFLIDSFENRI